jgi:catechol 2,3-dioxygenase-like lactoylglutathione lyase family enzyme
MGVIQGISEAAFWVEDLEDSVAFYRDELGLELESLEPGRHAFFKAGDALIALFNPANPGTALAEEYLARVGAPRGSVYHIALRAPQHRLGGLAEALRAAGRQVKGPIQFPSGRMSYFLEDPDGNYLELTDR